MRTLLFAALAFSVVMTGCKNQTSTISETESQENIAETKGGISDRIAYIDIDSLIAQYNMAIDLRAEIEAKYKKAETELQNRTRRLEKDVMDYQEKVQKVLITRSEAANIEENLNKQQQSLVEHRDKVLGELAEQEQVMNNKIYYAVVDYLKEFNADYKYAMIVSTTASGPILNADPSLNVTKEVLTVLNARYEQEKNSKK